MSLKKKEFSYNLLNIVKRVSRIPEISFILDYWYQKIPCLALSFENSCKLQRPASK
jgi:hypothetical protein